MTVVAALADVEPEDVTAGGWGFVVIAGLAVATALLLRSFRKQLKKVDFEEQPAEGDNDGANGGTPRPDGEA